MLNVGDEVMMIDNEFHECNPKIYPAKGSIGVVVKCLPDSEPVLVDWGQDSGVNCNLHGKYTWWCGEKRLAKVNANTQVNTQKEVCNMSKFKVGDKVVFTNAQKHETISRFYPAVGTVGTVKTIGTGALGENTLLVDWGDATMSWWCSEDDVKPSFTCEEYDYTDGEVWEMLKPKMKQFVPAYIENLDMYSPAVKDMVVAAYRSGYGRATKGRSFMIKPPVKKAIEKLSVDDSISTVLFGKKIVTFYKDDNSYNVANFAFSRENGGVEIYSDVVYSSAGDTRSFGFDVISDPDCEMYVAVPFSEVVGKFDSDSIKAMYGEDKTKILRYDNIEPWEIGEFHGFVRVSNETRALMEFKHEDRNLRLYPEIYRPEFKALIPLCEYLRVNGVNV